MYTHDMSEAEEIVAAILGDVWERRATLRIAVKISTYLHAAVKHRTLDWRRGRTRRAQLLQRVAPQDIPGIGTPAPGPDASVEQADLVRHVLRALRTLPERYQLAFVYRWRHGWDYTDIAATLGISNDAAKKAVSRALAMIRAQVEDFTA
jgi:RNA polymerase sigma-70 factor (ECF subfamily)